MDHGKVRFAAEQRRHIAVLTALHDRVGHIAANAGEAVEISLDIARRFSPLDTEPLCQPEGRDAVDDAEIDRLRLVAAIAVGAAENLLRRQVVDVSAVGIDGFQLGHVGDMRRQPQLDLVIVRR